jgi:NADPH-dependent ferric siderophore reductase
VDWHAEHIMSSAQHITRTGQFHTRVRAVSSLSPRMHRITLVADSIAAQNWPLASDIAVVLTGEDGREVRRRYTVRSVDGDALVLDAVLHGHGPGSSWAATATAGDHVTFFGPRGEVQVPAAGWLLALTDESGLPAIAALAESTEQPIQVLAEIANPDETYPLPGNATVTWLPRSDQPPGSSEILTKALDSVQPGRDTGYAYVLSESRAAVVLREALSRFGLTRADIYAKGYWNLNSRSAR